MSSKSLARAAGITGMVGAVLWVIGLITHNSISGSAGSMTPPISQPLGQVATACFTFGILGLIWGGAVKSWFGMFAVGLLAFGNLVLDLAGLLLLFSGRGSLLFPLGGMIGTLGLVLTGIAVVTDRSWSGWQRYVMLVYAAYDILFIILPLIAGIQPDGPGMAQELVDGVFLFLTGLAIYSKQHEHVVALGVPNSR